MAVLAALAPTPLLAQAPRAAQARPTAAPRTPWGHSDLQGVWANDNATPLERPKEIADKSTLTDGEVNESLSLRRISFGLPNTFAGYNRNYQIIQTPDFVVIATEMIRDARVVPLDNRPHLPSGIRQWLGDSRGHWEGNTLVVETTNVVDQSADGQSALRFSGDEHMHLVERFTRDAARSGTSSQSTIPRCGRSRGRR
jgi:hypothetical protein